MCVDGAFRQKYHNDIVYIYQGWEFIDLMVPVWDDILTPLYTDPGVNISYDILTPGSI